MYSDAQAVDVRPLHRTLMVVGAMLLFGSSALAGCIGAQDEQPPPTSSTPIWQPLLLTVQDGQMVTWSGWVHGETTARVLAYFSPSLAVNGSEAWPGAPRGADSDWQAWRLNARSATWELLPPVIDIGWQSNTTTLVLANTSSGWEPPINGSQLAAYTDAAVNGSTNVDAECHTSGLPVPPDQAATLRIECTGAEAYVLSPHEDLHRIASEDESIAVFEFPVDNQTSGWQSWSIPASITSHAGVSLPYPFPGKWLRGSFHLLRATPEAYAGMLLYLPLEAPYGLLLPAPLDANGSLSALASSVANATDMVDLVASNGTWWWRFNGSHADPYPQTIRLQPGFDAVSWPEWDGFQWNDSIWWEANPLNGSQRTHRLAFSISLFDAPDPVNTTANLTRLWLTTGDRGPEVHTMSAVFIHDPAADPWSYWSALGPGA